MKDITRIILSLIFFGALCFTSANSVFAGNVTLILANPPDDADGVFLNFWDSGTQQWTRQQWDPAYSPLSTFETYETNITGDYIYAYVCIFGPDSDGKQVCDGTSKSYFKEYYTAYFPNIAGSAIYFNASDPYFYLAINNFVGFNSRSYNLFQNFPADRVWEWETSDRGGYFDFAGINNPYFPPPPKPSTNVGSQFTILPYFINSQTSTANMTLDFVVKRPDGTTFTPATFGAIGNRNPGQPGGAGYYFIPTQAGNYTANFTAKANGSVIGSLSNVALVTVISPTPTNTPTPTRTPTPTPKPTLPPISKQVNFGIAPPPTRTPTPSPTNSPPLPLVPGSARVFITSVTYNGNLGGLAGADAKCQTLANNANLGGTTWKAWLSSSTTSSVHRLFHLAGPYKLVGGWIIANDWNDMITKKNTTYLRQPIIQDENGRFWPPVNFVWTATNTDGTTNSGHTCNNWTSSSSSSSGFFGWYSSSGSDWTNYGPNIPDSCNNNFHLYCFEK